MKSYVAFLLLLFVLGCNTSTSDDSSPIQFDKAEEFDKAADYIRNSYKDFQSRWLLNADVSQARIVEHAGEIDIADLSDAEKDALIAHAAAEVDHAVSEMGVGVVAEEVVEKEVFKLVLKTVFLKSIIEKPQANKFSFYPLYESEIVAGVQDPLAKFESLIGDTNIDKMVQSLDSDAPFSIDLKKDILTGLKTALSVSDSSAPTGNSLRDLQDDVQRWVGLRVPAVLTACPTPTDPNNPTFSEIFCSTFQITGTFSEYTDSIGTLLQEDFPTTFGIIKADLQAFRDDYIDADIAYLNDGIGTWLYPSSLENIVNDLKNDAEAADGDNANDFARILDLFVEKVTRGHSEDPQQG